MENKENNATILKLALSDLVVELADALTMDFPIVDNLIRSTATFKNMEEYNLTEKYDVEQLSAQIIAELRQAGKISLVSAQDKAMELSLEQRRELMDWIMKESSKAADAAEEMLINNSDALGPDDLEDAIIDARIKAGFKKTMELKKQYGFSI